MGEVDSVGRRQTIKTVSIRWGGMDKCVGEGKASGCKVTMLSGCAIKAGR